LYHPKSHGTFYHGITMVKEPRFLGAYECTIVIRCTMVYLGKNVPPEKDGKIYHGTPKTVVHFSFFIPW
jgi:hypothetical protein